MRYIEGLAPQREPQHQIRAYHQAGTPPASRRRHNAECVDEIISEFKPLLLLHHFHTVTIKPFLLPFWGLIPEIADSSAPGRLP